MPNEMEGEEIGIKSKYSSGINIILRLHQLWIDTHKHSRTDRFYDWNNDLDCIWRELARDLSKDGYDKWKERIDKVNNQLKSLGRFIDEAPAGFEEPPKELLEKREKQYDLLKEKQLLLARLENELGKGTTEEEENEYDFD